MKMLIIKLFQYNEKKVFIVLSLAFGLFFGGCSEFEVIDLEDPKLEANLKTFKMTFTPKYADYLFNDIFLVPYFRQSLDGYFGSYDLRLEIDAKTTGKEVKVVRVSIPQLNLVTDFQKKIRTEHYNEKSGLFFGHNLLISEIIGTDLYEAGSEGRTVDVIITAQIGDDTKTFNYSFSATKIKVAVPIR